MPHVPLTSIIVHCVLPTYAMTEPDVSSMNPLPAMVIICPPSSDPVRGWMPLMTAPNEGATNDANATSSASRRGRDDMTAEAREWRERRARESSKRLPLSLECLTERSTNQTPWWARERRA